MKGEMNGSFYNLKLAYLWNKTDKNNNDTNISSLIHLQLDLYSFQEDIPYVFKLFVLTIYSMSFLMTIFGNIVVFYSIITSAKSSKMDFFLVNFAASDTFMNTTWFVFSCVGHIVFVYWPLDLSMCKILRYLQNFLILQRSFSMVILSYEQHYVISNPIKTRTRSSYRVKLTTFVSWTLTAAITTPSFVFSNLVRLPFGGSSPGLCLEIWRWNDGKLFYTIGIMLLQYMIPLVVMAVLYFHIGLIIWTNKIPGETDRRRDHRITKSKIKSVKFLFSLVACFAVTWMPLYILSMIGEVNPHIYHNTGIYLLWIAFQLLAYTNSSINSVLFLTLNTKFRMCVKQLVASLILRRLEKLKKGHRTLHGSFTEIGEVSLQGLLLEDTKHVSKELVSTV